MNYLSIGEAASVIGVAVSTLRRWESESRLLPSYRTPGGHRRYAWTALQALIKPHDKPIDEPGLTLCYARVSSHDQKEDLVRQASRLKDWCEEKGMTNIEVISDLGSGLNYKKKGLNRLIRMITLREINHLVITHKDRLLRFGSEILFGLCKLNGISVSIIEEDKKISFEAQLSADVIELMTVFSAKLYGSRSHKNKKKTNNSIACLDIIGITTIIKG
jgi:excisionase family DNA binding protein